jgi:transcriptional regulator with XRE-family HTH domain
MLIMSDLATILEIERPRMSPKKGPKKSEKDVARTVPRTKGGVVHSNVARILRKLGADIAIARRVRQISTTDMAERMGVSRGTLRRLEKGDPGVSLNTLAMALSALGTSDRLTDLMDQAVDDIGLMTTRSALPKRITSRKSAKTPDPAHDETGSPDKKTDTHDIPEGW